MKSFLKKTMWGGWFCLPLVLWFWYQQYGHDALKYDRAGELAVQAQAAMSAGDYPSAVDLYEQARELIPGTDIARRQALTFAEAQAEIRTNEILNGSDKLAELLKTVQKQDPGNLEKEIRSELAASKYHTALLMRKEGAGPGEWRPIIEEARQQYRRLAENGSGKTDDAALKNLEAAVKLERMDQSLVQGLPLPKSCPKNCDGLSQRKRKQRKNKGKKKTPSKKKKKKKQKDARQQIVKKKIKDAGLNESEGGGS